MADSLLSIQWDELIRSKSLSVCLGLFSHVVLNNGEWDHSAHLILSFWIFVFGAMTVTDYAIDPQTNSVLQALQVCATTAAIYFGSLLTSLLLYRAFFHQLRKFPGPFGARLSKFYSVRIATKNAQYYNEIEKLHKKYNSDIIRTGPRELSVVTADAIPLVYGPLSKCTKGPWYSGSYHIEGASLQSTRSKADHKERRKVWDRAFSAKSLREYEPRVNRHTHALMAKLNEHAAEPAVRISNWINFYSFDVMGDIGFSRSFGMLEKGKEDSLIHMLHKSMAPLTFITHIVWTLGILMRLGGAKDMLDFMAWTKQTLQERKKITPKENDVFGWLLDPTDEDIPLKLNADSRLMIVAGSDTTAATLTWLCYQLCKNPDVQSKLREVVNKLAPEKTYLEAEDVANCPHLEGVVYEAVRLHPAVPGGTQRETPASGLTLPDGTYIPGNTMIWMPPHTLQRDARYFPQPLEFMPERWTDEKPDYVVDKRALLAFSAGPYNCVGQKLAVMEMKCVIGNLVRHFEMRFADGEDGGRVEKETRDCFTLNVGQLDVKLTPTERKGAA